MCAQFEFQYKTHSSRTAASGGKEDGLMKFFKAQNTDIVSSIVNTCKQMYACM